MTQSAHQEKLLTETELEMMRVLWSLGRGSVHDVLAGLSSERDRAYTSISTMLRILEKKGFVKSVKDGRAHVYEPIVPRADYEARTLKHMVESVFEGSRLGLVRQLLGQADVRPEELEELRRLLDRSQK
jgi:predicted transcriptional regulator